MKRDKDRVVKLPPNPASLKYEGSSIELQKVGFFNILFLYSAFFPWVSFRLNGLDSQPWPILLAFLAVLARKKIVISNFFVLIFFGIFLSILSVLIFSPQNVNAGIFLVFRSIAGYIGALLFLIAAYNIKRLNISISKHLNIISYIWFTAGLTQLVFGRYFLEFLVVVRTSDTRGVTSLAPEPTFYGMLILVLTWVMLLDIGKNTTKLPRSTKLALFANIISIIIFSKSSMTLLYVALLGVGLAFYVIKPSLRIVGSIIFSILVIIIISPFIISYLEGSRLVQVVETLIQSPLLLLEVDMSVNQRFSDIYFSVSGLLDGFGIPRGVGSFGEYASSIPSSFWGVKLSQPGEKIMSWVGVFIFELGFIGVFIIFLFLTAIYKGSEGYFRGIPVFCFMLIGLSGLPLGFAPLCILVGFYAAKSDAKYRKPYNCPT